MKRPLILVTTFVLFFFLWIPIWLHILMNAPWILFSVSNNGPDSLAANAFRGYTVCLAIGLTIRYKRRHGLPFLVTPRNLLTIKPAL